MRSLQAQVCALTLALGALSCPSPALAQSGAQGTPIAPPPNTYTPRTMQPYAAPPPADGYRPFSLVDDDGDPRQVWYGWQSLIIHGISASLLAVTPASDGAGAPFTVPAAITGMVFAGPIVHWAHGHTARGFGSLGLQVGGGLAGTLLAGATIAGIAGRGDAGLAFVYGSIFGAPIGATIGFIIDVSVLAYEPLTEKSAADMAKGWSLPALVPLVDVRKDRATFGVAGAF